ncbi:thiamine phosphate synthase [Prolixibacteraceae bacterium]|nr:thiamine phosphate synthase [Prolixibacteraceae bacterium]
MKFKYLEFQLQFITHGTDDQEIIHQVKEVLEGGGRWIQLRAKHYSKTDFLNLAQKIKSLTDAYKAVFIINDHINIAKQIEASGVHIGTNDITPNEAREILGPQFIIGGTANDIETIDRIRPNVDYIGLGPFRFTSTKKKLSPCLGIDGYKRVVDKTRKESNIPIVTIGGIVKSDIQELLQLDVQGIATSSGLTKKSNNTISKETALWIKEIKLCQKN